MKKYRVKKEHPGLQEGEMRKYKDGAYDFLSGSGFYLHLEFSKSVIKEWISEKWIEEIQEPEFTKDDMIKFAHSRAGHNTYTTDLDKWIKEYKNENKN